jgi:hypothetical protein
MNMTFPNYATERTAMLAAMPSPALYDLFERGPIAGARSVAARHVELERRKAAGLPLSLPRGFGNGAGPFVATSATSSPRPARVTATKRGTESTESELIIAAARLGQRIDELEAQHGTRTSKPAAARPSFDRAALARRMGAVIPCTECRASADGVRLELGAPRTPQLPNLSAPPAPDSRRPPKLSPEARAELAAKMGLGDDTGSRVEASETRLTLR